jgi:cobalt-zinc-cadmium efflux system outer membrane protein
MMGKAALRSSVPCFLALAASLATPSLAAADGDALAVRQAAEAARQAAAAEVPVESLLTDENALLGWLATRQPDIGAAKARVEQAEALVDQSRVIPNPTLGVGVGGIALGQRNPSSLAFGDTLNVTVGVSETIELGKRGPRAKAAVLRRDASKASAVDVLVNRLADARDAMARTIYFAERAHVLSQRLASAENVVALEQVRLDHGDISGIEHDRLELEAAAVARELADNGAELDIALADCSASLLGDCSRVTATMTAVDASAPLVIDAGSIDTLIQSRPDIRAARLAVAAAKTDAVLYRRQAIPDPTVGVSYTRDFLVAAGNQPNTLMANLSIPLPFFDHGQNLARQADAGARELAYATRSVEVRALAGARALFLRQDMLKKKLETLVSTSRPKSGAVLKSSDDAYHHGQLSLTDLIIVRREYAALLLESVETRYALFASRNEIYRTLGLGAPTQVPTASAASVPLPPAPK